MNDVVRTARALGIPLAVLALAANCLAADPAPTQIRLWPDKAPGEQGEVPPELGIPPAEGKTPENRRVTSVSEPSLVLFPAPSEKATGAAVIIAPGGAYAFLSWD